MPRFHVMFLWATEAPLRLTTNLSMTYRTNPCVSAISHWTWTNGPSRLFGLRHNILTAESFWKMDVGRQRAPRPKLLASEGTGPLRELFKVCFNTVSLSVWTLLIARPLVETATQLKNISQNGNLPQGSGWKLKEMLPQVGVALGSLGWVGWVYPLDYHQLPCWMSTLSQLSMVSDNGTSYLFKSAGVISNKVSLVMRFPQRLGIWLPKAKLASENGQHPSFDIHVPTIDLYRGYPPGY